MTHRSALRGLARRTPSTVLAAAVVSAVLVGAASTVDLDNARPAALDVAPDRPAGKRIQAERGTVFDDAAEVAKLHPALLAALRRASTDAGFAFEVNSGWRSAAHQTRLLREAIEEYGSVAEAARWVAIPEKSAHVSGDAVDLGSAAAAWLSEHGAAYGLCQTYRNEPWHYELRRSAAAHGCPSMYADPTHDPRMQ